MSKDLLGIISVVFVFMGYGVYLASIILRRTKPHMFSWIVWGIIGATAFAGQYVSGAGAGAWATGAIAALGFSIVILSLYLGEKRVTRADWVFFCIALSAIPVWYFTNDPLGAMVLVIFINTSALVPTIRKSWTDPYGESIPAWSLHAIRSLIVLFALERYTFVTAAFPVSNLVNTGSVALMLILRRITVSADEVSSNRELSPS